MEATALPRGGGGINISAINHEVRIVRRSIANRNDVRNDATDAEPGANSRSPMGPPRDLDVTHAEHWSDAA